MFNEKEKNNRIETLIGDKCTVIGSIQGEGLMKIDGTIEGDINLQDDIIIDINALCKSNINCKNATINGKVEGNIICENTLTIESYGKVTGNITVKNLVIKEGGILDGKCTMVMSKEPSEILS
ncbi:protein CcmA, bactofilin family [Clostridium sp. USBA 49]|jgi:cytoskeletal protein CcmA (bactofilin family)|uniref:bactofilin family protein n=1 Tax=Clostridium TaxID=1485 RepID=UPI00099A6C3F|nr:MULTISPECIES: polymer-forming cytoskeletal protein [Clostridium]SKA80823.1 protein CcmA, bactofilin family [Clostridium sp. USBA 49]